MLKELLDLVKENASDVVINNPDVPNEKNHEIVAEATNTVASGLRNIVAGGGLQSLLAMFGSGGNGKGGLLNNPIVAMMIGHLTSKLMGKYNLAPNQAQNISGSLIPNVLESLINKTNDNSNSTFSLEKLLASITGTPVTENGSGGLGDLLKGSGSQESGGGLMDLIKGFSTGALQQQQQNGNGGLMDLIKGFIK